MYASATLSLPVSSRLFLHLVINSHFHSYHFCCKSDPCNGFRCCTSEDCCHLHAAVPMCRITASGPWSARRPGRPGWSCSRFGAAAETRWSSSRSSFKAMAWSAHRNVEYARQHVTRYAGVLLVREVAMSTASGRTGATRSPEVHIAWLVTGVPCLIVSF